MAARRGPLTTSARKLAAILFTDIVGYTSLVSKDERKAAEVRERHRRLVQTLVGQFKGEWIEETGDETMSAFPSSVEAVHCALAIQAALADDPDLKVRIGIHIGDVLEQDGKLIGDGVNLAARIRPLAQPGGICVSERVWEDVRNRPEVQGAFLGDQKLKNVDHSLRVWIVSAPTASGRRILRRPLLSGPWRKAAIAASVLVVLATIAALIPPVRNAFLLVLFREGLFSPLPKYDQKIAFTTTSDGVRIAYATTGEGPPVVVALGWFSHIERGGQSPGKNPFITGLLGKHRLIIYDGRGTGLSDHHVKDYSLDAKVRDLEAVIEATGLKRFGLYGISAGGPTAIAYTVRHPERVTRLAFYGSFTRVDPQKHDQWKAMIDLARVGWGQDNPAFRQVFTSLFMPDGDELSYAFFNEFQRISTGPDDAVGFMTSLLDTDVRTLATQVRIPTLVVHVRGDVICPFEFGREIASLVPGAGLVTVEGRNHAFSAFEPAYKQVNQAIGEFFDQDLPAAAHAKGS